MIEGIGEECTFGDRQEYRLRYIALNDSRFDKSAFGGFCQVCRLRSGSFVK
jgi:hypothetical protein